DGFERDKCFTIGTGPWDLPALAPPTDPDRVAAKRARFPNDTRLIGTYGRLAKISPEFLGVVTEILRQLPNVTVILGGTGDGTWIRQFIAEQGLAGRLELIDHYVDGHVWGQMLDVFLETFPYE